MPKNIDVNTTSDYPTHFLRGVELIIEAREKFGIPSENWPHPIEQRFGIPGDKYYSEIWWDGMDWQNSYWVIETFKYSGPICLPFIVFEDHKNSDQFNSYDFDCLIKASLFERRDRLWIKENDDIFNDTVWSFFKAVEPKQNMDKLPEMLMFQMQMQNASQSGVEFFMNINFVPERKIQ
jgi:hypothetical protein